MKKTRIGSWLRNVSISKKLYFTVGIMALLIAIELMTMLFAINTLSSVRALVAAEGLWSKAQKDAVYNLQKYGTSFDENDFIAYQNFLKVNLGDRKARMELMKVNPDMDVAWRGFLEGRLHPEDIDGAIQLLRRFHNISYIAKATSVWTKGDEQISVIQSLADELHAEIMSAHPSKDKISSILKQIDIVNAGLTTIEDEFSYTLGDGSRWLTDLILRLLFGLVLTVEITGLSVTIFVSRGITTGLKEIIRSSKKIAEGDFSTRAKVFSGDEIGLLANSFNDMTDSLQSSMSDMKQMETERIKIIDDVVQRKNNLEQFSYIVSHNLRSPIANIKGIANVLQAEGHFNNDEKELIAGLSVAIEKLDDVIRDLNEVLKLKNEGVAKRELINFSEILSDIKLSNANLIKEGKVTITYNFSAVNEIFTVKGYLYSVFFNLISNSIKYQQPNIPPVIEIQTRRTNDKLEIIFRDNGMGIDMGRKGDQVFGLYKRFHTHVEGKGVGLFMVKTQVEALGGTISVSSQVNRGTQFVIQFKTNELLS
ncbi:hypothetical protein CJD36_009085 [Flavipsychrobacter stenotrophus]|uniref:histidine kinase n=1 Tax=Flavipsychrobacter stenotrophus TaxID=2077091 RepID=A0A2S7SZD5_9BACT|nr:sensor histidine kinase [Flavipsychrobacter stenotrophus]PQJ11935.1 hypothetical protein CJD36_009085 [Flavipsychrobacter stenotrophus]